MKPIFTNSQELADYFNFKPESSFDNARLEKAWKMYVTNYRGDGCMGCITEVLCASTHSNKTTVANVGKNDGWTSYRAASGKVYRVKFECKTNGGRLETLESEFSKAEKMQGRYVIYMLDVCNSGTSGKRRFVPAVIIPRKLFLEKLKEFNAIKPMRHGGKLDGYGIQATSKRLWLWLLDWPIVYDRNAIYSDDDFEGLE